MSNQHVLKIHPAPLADLLSGAKTAEVRRNDRGFQVGDTVRLMEVNPETGNWTGAADHVRTISHIQTGYGLPDGMCVLSYAQAEQQEARPTAEQLEALKRFHETCDDGEAYDVPVETMHQLAAMGLVDPAPRYGEHGFSMNAKGYAALSPRQEAQGAQAGDERAKFIADEAFWVAQVLEDIGCMEASFIEEDEVELQLEDDDGNSTTCTVSITEFSRRAASLIRELQARAALATQAAVRSEGHE